MKRGKRVTSLFLVVLLLMTAGGAQTAQAAEYTATSLRLEKTEGTVTVKNATGRTVNLKEGSRLFNGYEIKTGVKSYAWISLDDTKVLKLDAGSSVEIQKKNKDIVVNLKSGKLFFDAKKKLSSDESLNIKTSTMVTGIRGTSGVIEVVNENETRIQLYDGKVVINCFFAPGGKMKSETIEAGQIAYTLAGSEASSSLVEIVTEILKVTDIPGFAGIEIKADEELQKRIEEETSLDIQKIIDTALERQAEDEEALQKALETVLQELEKLVLEDKVDPLFGEETSGGGNSSSGTMTPEDDPEENPDDSPEPTYSTEVSVTGGAELRNAIANYNAGKDFDGTEIEAATARSRQIMTISVEVKPSEPSETVTPVVDLGSEDITIEEQENRTLQINFGRTQLKQDGALINNGTLILNGGADANPISGSAITSNGWYSISGGNLNDAGIENNGTLEIRNAEMEITQMILNIGTLKTEDSHIILGEGAVLDTRGNAFLNGGNMERTWVPSLSGPLILITEGQLAINGGDYRNGGPYIIQVEESREGGVIDKISIGGKSRFFVEIVDASNVLIHHDVIIANISIEVPGETDGTVELGGLSWTPPPWYLKK